MKHTTQIPFTDKIIQLFIGLDGHAVFTISLHLDANFVMTPRALRNRHLAAQDAPLVLRPKPVNLPTPSFEAQTGKTATSDVDTCLNSRQVPRRLQDLSCSRHTDSLLKLIIAFLLDLADIVFIMSICSCSSVHHVDCHDSPCTPRDPQSKPIRVYPSSSLVHWHEPFA